jgi:hypothetical protein
MWAIVAGLVILGIGAVLIIFGIFFSLAEYKKEKELGDAASFVDSLAGLVKAISGQPRSVVFFTFGTLLIFLGGIIAGVSGLTLP